MLVKVIEKNNDKWHFLTLANYHLIVMLSGVYFENVVNPRHLLVP